MSLKFSEIFVLIIPYTSLRFCNSLSNMSEYFATIQFVDNQYCKSALKQYHASPYFPQGNFSLSFQQFPEF